MQTMSETVAKSTGSMPRSLDRTLHPGEERDRERADSAAKGLEL
jgi:hypothetical protein